MAEDDSGSALDNLASRRAPFWTTVTPNQENALEAAQFFRQAQANAFVADTDPSVKGTLGDIVGGDAGQPATPFPGPARQQSRLRRYPGS